MSPSRILAHRGLWSRPELKNTREALLLALSCNFGVETDIRDQDSQLVISHDPPARGALRLSELLEEYRRLDAQGVLAFNVKSDGLAAELRRMMESYSIDRYFAFDMSVPDMLHYQRLGIPFFSRRSDIETEVVAMSHCQGVWLDCFRSDWYSRDTVVDLLFAGKQVAVVSPELHGRDCHTVWRLLRQIGDRADHLLCCTDYPVKLQEWMS